MQINQSKLCWPVQLKHASPLAGPQLSDYCGFNFWSASCAQRGCMCICTHVLSFHHLFLDQGLHGDVRKPGWKCKESLQMTCVLIKRTCHECWRKKVCKVYASNICQCFWNSVKVPTLQGHFGHSTFSSVPNASNNPTPGGVNQCNSSPDKCLNNTLVIRTYKLQGRTHSVLDHA